MTEIELARRVVKLGGSLLELPDVIVRFKRWLNRQPEGETVLVVGGGREVDALRAANEQWKLDDKMAHWLCVAAMAANARMIAAALKAPLVGAEAIHAGLPGWGVRVLDPWRFLWDEEPRLVKQPLPESWDVTSDSIAARVADVLEIEELVLLKSCLPEKHATFDEAVVDGYVDRFFPKAVRGGHVRCVDLCAANRHETWLRP